MGKVKLNKFELVASVKDTKKLVDYLQRFGCTHIENTTQPELEKSDFTTLLLEYSEKQKTAVRAIELVEKSCEIKKSMLSSLSDYTEVSYDDYKRFVSDSDETFEACETVVRLGDETQELLAETVRRNALIEYYRPWEKLDIPMSSTCTGKTSIFIGYVRAQMTGQELKMRLAEAVPDVDGVVVSEISISKMQSCFVVICHRSKGVEMEKALSSLGFSRPDNPAKTLPALAIKEMSEANENATAEISKIKEKISSFSDRLESFKYLVDYYDILADRAKALEKSGSTKRVIYFEGYVPEKKAEEMKFNIESRFTASVSITEPDYEAENVPVMLQNGSFASGVENITEMYSAPSNDDLDPNPVMAFFYYALFGLMLSDGGYGILMVIFGALMKWKFKVTGAKLKTANFAFFCGVFTIFWGAMFGSWFGDLIPTLCTNFFGMENGPNLAIWFDPKDDSMKLLLYSFGFGIIHLFVGLAIRFVNLCKHKQILGAICDVIPVYVFVTGFAIVGKNFISPVTEQVMSIGYKLLLIGAILIVLTAGRSAKNIFGKLGGGLYGLYNTTTGYMSDILSYSRLLALNLVTGVIGMVVNLLAAMPGNIIFFIIIFIVGHGVNMAINLIGTYVHTNRLQYVEYFSKFYEGGGRVFTPFKLNTNYLRFREDK